MTSAAAFTVTDERCYRRQNTLTLGAGETFESTIGDLLAMEPTDSWRVAKVAFCGKTEADFQSIQLWFADYSFV